MTRKIRAYVEMGTDHVEEILDLPENWDDMTQEEQDEYLTETAVTLQNNEAPCGAEVIETDE